MITIEKKYHFYAAHRNENLVGSKCSNIHGHTYYVTASFIMPEQNEETGVTLLFSDIDKEMEPLIKHFDHGFLIHAKDPLINYLSDFNSSEEHPISLIVLAVPTSLENLVEYVWHAVESLTPLRLNWLTIQETTSSSITKYKN